MIHPQFETALALLDTGNVEQLQKLFIEYPDLAAARDDGNATLLIRLIDWPGHRPRSGDSARVLLENGVEIDARRDHQNGTALAGALCTKEVEVIRALLEFNANVDEPLGWMDGTVFDLADWTCQDQRSQSDSTTKTLIQLFAKYANRKIPSRVPLGGTTPIIFVNDFSVARDFYIEELGFHVDWAYEADGSEADPYMGISRGGAEFHLTQCNCDNGRHAGNLWVRVECEQVDDFFKEIEDREIKILNEPQNQPWGFREIVIEDPEGNRLTFYGPTVESQG